MKMKHTILAAMLLAAGGFTLWAQDDPPPPPEDGQGPGGPGGDHGGPGGPMGLSLDKLKTDLKLTDEQAAKLQPLLDKIKELFKSMREEMHDLMESGDHDAMKAKMEEIQKKILSILEPAKEFLSADQYKTLVEKFTRRPGRPNGGPDGGPDGGPGGGPDGGPDGN